MIRIALGIIVLGLGACSKQQASAPPAATTSKPATTSAEPPAKEVSHEEIKVVPTWSVRVVEVTRGPEESDALVLDLYTLDANGKRTLVARDLIGGLLYLQDAQKIFSCEDNTIFGTETPILLDLNGNRTTLAPHRGYLEECLTVGSGNEVMMVYNADPGVIPDTVWVRVFDANGVVLVERQIQPDQEVEYEVSGKAYRARIPKIDDGV